MSKQFDFNVESNVSLTVVDKFSGEVVREQKAQFHNSITGMRKLIDLITGEATDHVDTSAIFIIKDSGGTTRLTKTSQASGYPTVPGSGGNDGMVAFRFEDETADTYDPEDVFLYTSGSNEIARSEGVTWASKTAAENWYFTWEITLSSTDESFQAAGFNGMLDCVINRDAGSGLPGSQHWDSLGSGHANNMSIKVYDVSSSGGTLVVDVPTTDAIVITDSSIKWIFVVAPTTAAWRRVETVNNAQNNILYIDDIGDESQTSVDTFTYTITINFS